MAEVRKGKFREQWEKAKQSIARVRERYKATEAEMNSKLKRMMWRTIGFVEVSALLFTTGFIYGFVENPDSLGYADGVIGFGLVAAGVGLSWFDEMDGDMHVSDHLFHVGMGVFGHFAVRQGYKLAEYVKDKNAAESQGRMLPRGNSEADTGARRFDIPRAPIRAIAPRSEAEVLHSASMQPVQVPATS